MGKSEEIDRINREILGLKYGQHIKSIVHYVAGGVHHIDVVADLPIHENSRDPCAMRRDLGDMLTEIKGDTGMPLVFHQYTRESYRGVKAPDIEFLHGWNP
jgi:hypothetical protein